MGRGNRARQAKRAVVHAGVANVGSLRTPEGECDPRPLGALPWVTALSVRHHRDRERVADRGQSDPKAGSGNVLFADSHCEFVPHSLTLDPRHYELRMPQQGVECADLGASTVPRVRLSGIP